MKEQKEITFKSDFDKALIYSKRLLNKSLYHSFTIKQKLENKYDRNIVYKTMEYLKNNRYFNDELYINELKDLYKSRYYGIKKFESFLIKKGISIKENNYTFDEEMQVLQGYLLKIKKKIISIPYKERYKKVNYYLKYKGFSIYNISKIDLVDIIEEGEKLL